MTLDGQDRTKAGSVLLVDVRKLLELLELPGAKVESAPLPAAVAPADKPAAVPGERPLRLG